MSDDAIYIEDLHTSVRNNFWEPRHPILQGMSLRIARGSTVGFLGPNGAGKTTTIKAILDLIRIDRGTIRVFESNNRDMKIRQRIGFMPERPYFPEYLTGQEILRKHGRLAKIDETVLDTRIPELLYDTGIEHAARDQLRHYSKGMLQRLGLAQALIGDPDLLILDEPLSDLDPIGRSDVRHIMRKMKQRGKTILFSTHILPDVEELCDRIAIIIDGKLHKEDSVHNILTSFASIEDLFVREVQSKTKRGAA